MLQNSKYDYAAIKVENVKLKYKQGEKDHFTRFWSKSNIISVGQLGYRFDKIMQQNKWENIFSWTDLSETR